MEQLIDFVKNEGLALFVSYPVKNNPGRIISLRRQYEDNEYQPPDDLVLRMGQVDQINEKRLIQIFENIKDKGDIKPA